MAEIKQTAAVVGLGQFGVVMCKLLARNPELKVVVSSRRQQSSEDLANLGLENVELVDLKTAVNSDFVFPCVPISTLEEWVEETAKLVDAQSQPLFFTVCSVMSMPTEWLLAKLPANCDIASVHPLFGPSSSKEGTNFKGLRWVTNPTRITDSGKYDNFSAWLASQGLNIIALTPEEHDKHIAYTQAYGFFIGQLGGRLGVKSTPVDTIWFGHLYANQQSVLRDTEQLFHDMFSYNPYAKAMLEELQMAVSKLSDELNHG